MSHGDAGYQLDTLILFLHQDERSDDSPSTWLDQLSYTGVLVLQGWQR